jgi:hypothetical protein
VTTKTYPDAHPTHKDKNKTSAGSYEYTRDGKTYKVYPGGRPGRGYQTHPEKTHIHIHTVNVHGVKNIDELASKLEKVARKKPRRGGR